MRKILKRLKLKQYLNSIHFFAIEALLIIFALRYSEFYVLLAIYLFYLIMNKLFIKEIIVFGIIILLIANIQLNKKSSLSLGNINVTMEVDSINYHQEYTRVTFKYNEEKLIAYVNDFNYLPGDILAISGKLKEGSTASYDGDFDYKQYLSDHNIYYIIDDLTYNYENTDFNINRYRYEAYNYLKKRLEENTLDYVSTLVLGIKDESSLAEQLDKINMSYLIAISGMHIVFLFKIIFTIIFSIYNKYEESETISVVILGGYILFLGFPISALRAYIFLVIRIINKRRNLLLSSLDIWSITIILFMVISPKLTYQTGFILTFLTTFSYTILADLSKKRSKLISGFIMSLLMAVITLPLIININGHYNLLSILLSPFFIFLYSSLLLPFAFICAIFPSQAYENIFVILNKLQGKIVEFKLNIALPNFNFYSGIIYYLIVIFILVAVIKKRNKTFRIVLAFIYLGFLTNIRALIPYGEVTFIDVGQGDSVFISLPNNKANILIDCFNDNTSYLKSKGIVDIDYVFITHSDIDHMGSLEELCTNFNVKNIVGNYYDDDLKKNKILKYADNSMFVKCDEQINIEGYIFKILSPIEEKTEKNNNSLVIEAKFGELNYLFTGDIYIDEELKIIEKYPNLDVDVLKVAHHGSSTSNCEEFIAKITPTYSIISVGIGNRYGFPTETTLATLNKYSKVYQTMNNGNISFIFNSDKTSLKIYKNTI